MQRIRSRTRSVSLLVCWSVFLFVDMTVTYLCGDAKTGRQISELSLFVQATYRRSAQACLYQLTTCPTESLEGNCFYFPIMVPGKRM